MESVSVVLVHGAWADGYSWSHVIPKLKQLGFHVLAAPLPLTSFQDDVDALERSLSRAPGPLVVVGHAYAGAVIAQAYSDRLKGLVYIAALAPDEGETVAEVSNRDDHHKESPELAPDEGGFIWLPEAAFGGAFAQNANAEELAVLTAVQRPISLNCITTPVSRPSWKDVPTWFLLAEEDRMIPPSTQHFMAQRMNAQVTAADADHTPSITSPEVVVEVIRRAAEAVQMGQVSVLRPGK